MIDDESALALCVWSEARGEPDDGKAAVAQVVLNRARMRYSAPEGTIISAVFAPGQFSGFYFDWVAGRYTRTCRTVEQAKAKAERLLKLAQQNPAIWADCFHVADLVRIGQYAGGPAYQALTPDTVLYLNPAVVHPLPAWADPAKQVTVIGHHHFFRVGPVPAPAHDETWRELV